MSYKSGEAEGRWQRQRDCKKKEKLLFVLQLFLCSAPPGSFSSSTPTRLHRRWDWTTGTFIRSDIQKINIFLQKLLDYQSEHTVKAVKSELFPVAAHFSDSRYSERSGRRVSPDSAASDRSTTVNTQLSVFFIQTWTQQQQNLEPPRLLLPSSSRRRPDSSRARLPKLDRRGECGKEGKDRKRKDKKRRKERKTKAKQKKSESES